MIVHDWCAQRNYARATRLIWRLRLWTVFTQLLITSQTTHARLHESFIEFYHQIRPRITTLSAITSPPRSSLHLHSSTHVPRRASPSRPACIVCSAKIATYRSPLTLSVSRPRSTPSVTSTDGICDSCARMQMCNTLLAHTRTHPSPIPRLSLNSRIALSLVSR